MGSNSPDFLTQIRNSHELDLSNKRNLQPMNENLERSIIREKKGKKAKKSQNSPTGAQFTLRLDQNLSTFQKGTLVGARDEAVPTFDNRKNAT